MIKKKIIAFVLSVVAICSLVGCGNKEDAKTEKPNNEIVSQETEKSETKTENSIVGTWVVEKNEIYDGPLKDICKQVADTCYPVGAEYIFTDDGVYKSSDDKYVSTYEILSDNRISFIAINGGDTIINDYVLNGDTLVVYACYTDNVHTGYPSATYYKRKGV